MPTPLGLPYPDPDDPVSLGAADIRALAEAVDALLTLGEIETAQIVANSGSFTAEVAIPGLGLSTSRVYPGGRRYRLTASVNPQSTVLNDLIRLRLKDGAGVLTTCDHVVVRASTLDRAEFSHVLTLTAGTHNLHLTAERPAGTGSAIIAAQATSPAQITLEDLGPV